MSGRWDTKKLPHKGWECVGVTDLGDSGQMDESDYATCEMCQNERIRYVHTMKHPKVEEPIDVGCICASKMSSDYVGPKNRERVLRNKASRKSRWLTRKWRKSAKGNHCLNVDGANLGVDRSRRGWGYRLDDRFSTSAYATSDEAKLALFEAHWAQIQSEVKSWNDQPIRAYTESVPLLNPSPGAFAPPSPQRGGPTSISICAAARPTLIFAARAERLR